MNYLNVRKVIQFLVFVFFTENKKIEMLFYVNKLSIYTVINNEFEFKQQLSSN